MHSDIRRTLLFLIKDDHIVLAMKKRGFGAGKWNGIGGKLDKGESVEQALIRECQEEIRVTPTHYEKVAELDFVQDASSDPWHMFVYAYLCRNWEGDPTETEEMAPKWFSIDHIPYAHMWDDDEYWLPLVIAGNKVTASFTFDENDRMLSQDIKTVGQFD